MKHWLKLLVSIALAISIPLQGVAAVSMPICEDASPILNMTVDKESNTSVLSTSEDCHNKSTNCSDEISKDCSHMKCSFCHVSVSQSPEADNIVFIDVYSTAHPDLTIQLYQHFSPPLLRPPKQSFF